MYSMTGFGSATRETPLGRLGIELRSVNNRFLEINLRLGSAFVHLETPIRTELRNRLRRGKVDITLRFDPSEAYLPKTRINLPLLRSLVDQLRAIPGTGDVRPEALLQVPGAVVSESDPATEGVLDKHILQLLDEALKSLLAERAREGDALRQAFLAHHANMRAWTTEISAGRAEVVSKYRDRLFARLEELLGPKASSLDPGRLEQEVAVFADKADIAEECSRLDSHLEALAALLRKDDDAVGRALEFLSQEILREINTIGSKCRDLEIARRVLDLKAEVESLRENIANVE